MDINIDKISKLKIPKSFLQVDFVKGFKYVDKAGEILNNYILEDGQEPLFKMDLEGLRIKGVNKVFDEVKVSPRSIWASYSEVNTLDQVRDDFTSNHLLENLNILDVNKVKRVGWRNHFVREIDSKNHDHLLRFGVSENLSVEEIVLSDSADDFKVTIRIKQVVNTETEKVGVLFDVDTYKVYSDFSDIKDLNEEFKSTYKLIKSDFILDIINGVLSNNIRL